MGGVSGDWAAPASSWDMTRFDYDCASSCHSGTAIGGTFPVFGGSGKKVYQFGGQLTEKIWDGGGTEGRAWVQVDSFLTSTNPIQRTPGNASTLSFDANYRCRAARPGESRILGYAQGRWWGLLANLTSLHENHTINDD
jgi:hypothetical protein